MIQFDDLLFFKWVGWNHHLESQKRFVIWAVLLSDDHFPSINHDQLSKKVGLKHPAVKDTAEGFGWKMPFFLGGWRLINFEKKTRIQSKILKGTLPETNIAHENPHLSW